MITEREIFNINLARTGKTPVMLEIAGAKGIFIFDTSGQSYIDLISGISVSNLGHNNREIISAVTDQVEKHMHLMVYGEYIQSSQVQFASLITSILPDDLKCLFLVNSGSEAVEGALKLAKRYTGRNEIIAMNNAYHGSTHGALSVMGNEALKLPFRPLLPDVRFIEFNNHQQIDEITSKTACVIAEPVQGEAGIIPSDEDYLGNLKNRCDETGALLIFDEVQTGFGRTGTMFAFQHYGVIPDILIVAKAMGGGMPLGGFISSHEIMHSLAENPALSHITTFGGHPVSCAAALASLKILLRENYINEVLNKEKLFRELLVHPYIKSVRGKGLLLAVETDRKINISEFQRRCIKKGIITDWFLFCDTAFRVSPPLIITPDEIDKSCRILLSVLNEF
jgi:acetylornithine/succinyldiaminopimelate/putrescine aminotransferase